MTGDLQRLLIAPELIAIELVDAALLALCRALLVEHPTLDGPPSTEDPPIRRRAHRVLRRARRLSHALDAYRVTAEQIIDDALDDHDLPF